MDSKIHHIAFFCIAISALMLPACATPKLEGHLGDAKTNGDYDVVIQVWKQTEGAPKPSVPSMVVRIPRVSVKDGKFSVLVDVGLEAYSPKDLSFSVEARPFQSWGPFQPGEIANFEKTDEGTLAFNSYVSPNGALP